MSDDLVDVDTMLSFVGDFGKYQIILMSLFSLLNILSAFHYFGQTFISVIPEFNCNTTYYLNDTNESNCYTVNNSERITCDSGWIYSDANTYGYISIVQENNWVCSDAWKPALGQSVFFIGSVIGSLILGVLADRIGRLHVLVIANMLALIGNLVTMLSSNAVYFGVSRFIAGCATDSNFVMMYIIVMEYIRPSLRTMTLNLCIGIFYCFSCMAVPWVAVLLGNWRYFLLTISLPHIFILLFYLIVPESAQWLISKNQIEKALKCFKKIATINQRVLTNKEIDGLKLYYEKNAPVEGHESLLGLIKTPKLRRKTTILIFKSMVMTLCYDAISRNINGLKYSPFIVFTITSSTILPACLFITAIQDKIGRKALASSALLLTGLFTAGSAITQSIMINPQPLAIILLTVIARLGINIAYNSGAQYAVELIPTCVRGQGVSAIHVAGYAASFFSPQILFLSTIWKPFPEVILGVLLIAGAIACLFLPETLNKTLPVTLKDGEEFGEEEGVFEFACFKASTESTTALHVNDVRKYS